MMAIKLIANYSKRLGLPGYSSHQFSVSVKTDLVTTDDVVGQSARLYQRLQSTVDEQILNTSFVPPADYGMDPPEPHNTNPHHPGEPTNVTTGLTPWAQCLPDHISPTAAKAYLSCSLKFYFERVACIRKATPAAAKPDAANAAFDHEIQLVSYQLLMGAATGESPPSLDLVFLVKTKKPQTIRVTRPPADARRRPPQTAGCRAVGNRRRRHRQQQLPPATRDAMLVVPIQE